MDNGCGLKKYFRLRYLKKFLSFLLIKLLNKSLIISLGNVDNFHTIKNNKKEVNICSLLFLPLGIIHLYLFGLKKTQRGKKVFFCYKNKLEEVMYKDLNSKGIPVNFEKDFLTINENDLEQKFKQNLFNYFYNTPKEEREFIFKELENRIKDQENRENLALRKILFYFSFFSVFFGYLISLISYDFFLKLFQKMITENLIIFIISVFLLIHLFFYAANVILLSLYGLSIKYFKRLSFGEFKRVYSPKVSYLRSLYFKWYKLANFEVDYFLTITRNIEKFIKLFFITFLLFTFLFAIIKFTSTSKSHREKNINIFIYTNGVKI